MHDIYIPQDPPNRQPIPLLKAGDRIGTPYVPCGPEKLLGLLSPIFLMQFVLGPIDDVSMAIGENLVNFFKAEAAADAYLKSIAFTIRVEMKLSCKWQVY